MDVLASLTFRHEKFFLILVTCIAALGGFLFGYDTGIISGALVFIRLTYPMTTFTQEIIVSAVVFGALLGALFSGRLTDAFGSRQMLIFTAITFIGATILSALATNVPLLIAGRFLVGIAIGVTSYASPLLISEMAPASNRGRLVLLNGIMITAGETMAFLVDYLLVPTQSWRLMFMTGLIPAILLLFGMVMLPASPRWLLLKGHVDKARAALHKIRPVQDVNDEWVEMINNKKLNNGTWAELFSKQMRPVLIIGAGLGLFQQFIGINTVMYYGPTIFKAVGFQGESAQMLATVGVGVMNTLMTIVAVFIIEKVGRRNLLLGGLFVASISLSLVGLIFYCDMHTPLTMWLAFSFLMIYIAGYCLSLGSLFWLIISEIYPLSIRSLAMSFATAIQWAASFIVALTFLSIIDLIGIGLTFCIYAFMCLLAFVFCHYLVPETTGVSLEHIERNLKLGKRSRELGRSVIC